MNTYKIQNQFNITGRGLVMVVDLGENDLKLTCGEAFNHFYNKEIEIEGKNYIVRGVERHMPGMDVPIKWVGLLVKELPVNTV